ncbi:hypothetical protein JTE90_019724 [Oedothorax gibbosus]|uniref:Uncharacterized protein n=1 Tax=Oedothorax gibbosus TaxID=931172 RepID=A0AAV6UPF5_9ARAC|nr:hypothetical protein JTE90_019724 [Oedothorax gibbosus]
MNKAHDHLVAYVQVLEKNASFFCFFCLFEEMASVSYVFNTKNQLVASLCVLDFLTISAGRNRNWTQHRPSEVPLNALPPCLVDAFVCFLSCLTVAGMELLCLIMFGEQWLRVH